MGAFRCPNCQATVNAESPQGLVCPSCGFGSPGGAVRPPMAAQPWGGVPPVQGAGPLCPRCGSNNTRRGGIPTWAVICAVVLFFVVCVLSLLFLIAKDDNECYNCGMHWRQT